MNLLASGGDGGNVLGVLVNFPLYIWLWATIMIIGELI